MPYGPLFPVSAYPSTSGKVYPGFHTGAGSYSKQTEGMKFIASLDGDAYWELRFRLPDTLPVGTAHLHAFCLANATSGSAKLTVLSGMCAAGSAPDDVNVAAESESTVTWGADDADVLKELDVTITQTTLTGGDLLVVRLKGATTGWTLAAVLTVAACCIVWV